MLEQTLKNAIYSYKNSLIETTNLEILEKKFSDELIADLDLYNSNFKNSQLTNIKFLNINFEYSVFENCLFEKCVFENANLDSMSFEHSTLKNCLLINCNLNDSNSTETIFQDCQFHADKKGSISESCFESCTFIRPIFNGFTSERLGAAVLINSKFCTYNKSVEFQGTFYFIDLLNPQNSIITILNSCNKN